MARIEPSQTDAKLLHQRHTLPSRKKGHLFHDANQQAPPEKVHRRSSKPIINWLQRKLAGGGKTKKEQEMSLVGADLAQPPSRSRNGGRVVSSPLPSSPGFGTQPARLDTTVSIVPRKTISLNGDDDYRGFLRSSTGEDIAGDRSSLARESLWSPLSVQEADDDASVRPIPPSVSSLSPSLSSSSYLSDPRTFRSMTASTKPTTVLSIDVGNGMAHIAQAPLTPHSHHRVHPHVRQSSSLSNPNLTGSGNSITFSSLPQSSPSRPESLRNIGNLSSQSAIPHGTFPNGVHMPVQAPLHTTHHPRNNPRPSSPPLDNASILTLASSAFAMPTRLGLMGYGTFSGDSMSHFGGSTRADIESTSQDLLGDEERDDHVDASLRALRPRSSRRGSWESELSRWSARVQHGAGSPSLVRERSLWTNASGRTGIQGVENGDADFQDGEPGQSPNISSQLSSTSGVLDPADVSGNEVSVQISRLTVTGPELPAAEEVTKEEAAASTSLPRQLSSETLAQNVASLSVRTSGETERT